MGSDATFDRPDRCAGVMGDTGCPRFLSGSPVLTRVVLGQNIHKWSVHFQTRNSQEERRRHDAWPLPGWELLLLAVLVAIVAMNIARSPYYLGVGNIVNLFQLSIEKIIVALMLTLIIVNAEIDLSVASIMGLAAAVMAWLFQLGVPLPLAILAAMVAGALAGLNNGFWIAYLGLPSLAVTLAGLIGYRGIARILLEDRAVGNYPEWFNALGQQPLLGPLTLDHHFPDSVRRDRGRAASLGARPTGLRDGQQPRDGPLFGRAGEAGQARPVRRVRRGRRARRPALRGPARIRARRHRARIRARHHHHRSARRRQHLRGLGQSDRGRSLDPRHPQPSQRHGSGQHHGQHPDERDRAAADPVGARSEPGTDGAWRMEREA